MIFIMNKCNIYVSAYSAIVLSIVRWLIRKVSDGGGGATTRDIYCCDSITAITASEFTWAYEHIYTVLRCLCFDANTFHLINITLQT